MDNFAKRIKKNMRIKQGEKIGYVGSTGRSTGPHLHYEVLRGGKQIDPKTLKTIPRKKLSAISLAIFRYYRRQLDQMISRSERSISENDIVAYSIRGGS